MLCTIFVPTAVLWFVHNSAGPSRSVRRHVTTGWLLHGFRTEFRKQCSFTNDITCSKIVAAFVKGSVPEAKMDEVRSAFVLSPIISTGQAVG